MSLSVVVQVFARLGKGKLTSWHAIEYCIRHIGRNSNNAPANQEVAKYNVRKTNSVSFLVIIFVIGLIHPVDKD